MNEYSTSLRRSTGDNASLEDEAEEELEEELRYGVRSSQVILGAATQSSPGSSSSSSGRWTYLCYITRQVLCNKTKASPNLRPRHANMHNHLGQQPRLGNKTMHNASHVPYHILWKHVHAYATHTHVQPTNKHITCSALNTLACRALVLYCVPRMRKCHKQKRRLANQAQLISPHPVVSPMHKNMTIRLMPMSN